MGDLFSHIHYETNEVQWLLMPQSSKRSLYTYTSNICYKSAKKLSLILKNIASKIRHPHLLLVRSCMAQITLLCLFPCLNCSVNILIFFRMEKYIWLHICIVVYVVTISLLSTVLRIIPKMHVQLLFLDHKQEKGRS